MNDFLHDWFLPKELSHFEIRAVQVVITTLLLLSPGVLYTAFFVYDSAFTLLSFKSLNIVLVSLLFTAFVVVFIPHWNRKSDTSNYTFASGIIIILVLIFAATGNTYLGRSQGASSAIFSTKTVMVVIPIITLVFAPRGIIAVAGLTTIMAVLIINITVPIQDVQLAALLQDTQTQTSTIIESLMLTIIITVIRGEWERRSQGEREQTRQAEANASVADAANAAKSQFLAIVNHELRTPLNSLLPLLKDLTSKDDGEFYLGSLNNVQYEYLMRSQQSAQQLYIVVNDVLNASRIEASDTIEIQPQLNDLKPLLVNVVRIAENLAFHKKKSLCVQLVTMDNLPRLIFDMSALRQVLLNLLSNAIKFTKEGHITLSVYAATNSMRFSISDTGQGIAQKNQARLFAPWQQAIGRRTQGEGSGLGLYIANQFVTAHGGHIWFESALGYGTTFYIDLPYISEQRDG